MYLCTVEKTIVWKRIVPQKDQEVRG